MAKLLYIINSLEIGGAEIGLANMANRKLFSGHDFLAVSIWPASDHFLQNNPTLRQQYIGCLVPSSKRSSAHILSALRKYRHLIHRVRPDLVIASLPQANLIARLYKILFGGPEVICFEHNVTLGSRFAELAMRATQGAVGGAWADSDATLDSSRKAGRLPPGIPTAVVALQDLTDYTSQVLPDFSSSQHLDLLFVGRLAAQKNLPAAVEAIRTARRRGVPVRLSIIGEGPERERLQALSIGLEEVQLIGPLYDWHQKFSGRPMVGLLVSHHEGLSLTGLQLLAMGFPLITTAPGEVARYAQDGVNSWIAGGTSIDAIVDAIIRAWEQVRELPRMSTSARETATAFGEALLRDGDVKARSMISLLTGESCRVSRP